MKKAKRKKTFPSLVVRKWRLEGGKAFPPIPNERKRQWGMGIHYPPTPKEKEVAKNWTRCPPPFVACASKSLNAIAPIK